METGLTGFNGPFQARVHGGRMCDPRTGIPGTYILHMTTIVHCARVYPIRGGGRESLENACASNRRASNRTRRETRQPVDTIVTGCINPPSWYSQGRASKPKVNALGSHRSPFASSASHR